MTIIELIRMVSALLEELDGAAPITKDLREGFPRPCTYIEPLSTDFSRGAGGAETREDIELRVTYFGESTHQGYLTLLRFQAALAERLTMPIIGDAFTVFPEDVSFDLDRDEMVLECEFTVSIFQSVSKDENLPLMEILVDKEG